MSGGNRPTSDGCGRCKALGCGVGPHLVWGLFSAAMPGVSAIARAQAQNPAALGALIRQAEAGIPKAQRQLGMDYFHGTGGLTRSAAESAAGRCCASRRDAP